MKKCVLCQTSKELSGFNKKRSAPDGLQNVCRECNRARSRRYYAENHDLHRENVSRRKNSERVRQRALLKEYKEKTPCSDCNLLWPSYVLDFDHVGDNKSYNVSRMVGTFNDEKLWMEIAKCELVCANCHRVRTHNRRVSKIMD